MPDGLPPHSVEAEEAVIAALLLDDSAIARVAPILKPEDFFREQNGEAYAVALSLFSRGEEVTAPTMLAELEGEEWPVYLVELTNDHLHGKGVEAHARIVARDSFYRKLISACSEAAGIAYEGNPDPAKAYSQVLNKMLTVVPPSTANDPRPLGKMDAFYMEEGIKTGIPILDKNMGGLTPGKLTVVAAGSSVGKSMLAVDIMWAAAEQDHPVFVASMEMDTEYDQRVIKHVAQVPFDKILTEDMHNEVQYAAEIVASKPIQFWSRPRITIDELWARAYAMKADQGLDLIVVDYLQLMEYPSGKDNEATRIGMVTSKFKKLATELNCHVLLLAQMNRGAASEMRGREATKDECIITGEKYAVPFIEALKGSGSIEQDSDHVVFIARHNDCFRDSGNTKPANHASVVLAKNRSGVTGSCLVKMDMARSTITGFTDQECFSIAGADMYKLKTLRIDQGHAAWGSYED